jgi:succinoglycan biosynthesis transport protein ExoP
MELKAYLRVLIEKWWIVLPVFLVTFGLTVWMTVRQVPVYQTSATYIVRPVVTVEDERNLLSGLEVVSRRAEIGSTYAEVASSRLIKTRAAEKLGLSSAQRRALSVDSQLVAGTNVLKIAVSGTDPVLLRDFADAVGMETMAYVEELYETYQLTPLDTATVPGSPVKPDKALNLALGAILGLVLGAFLAFLGAYLQTPKDPASVPGTLKDEVLPRDKG